VKLRHCRLAKARVKASLFDKLKEGLIKLTKCQPSLRELVSLI
jgi:hypothetical protein